MKALLVAALAALSAPSAHAFTLLYNGAGMHPTASGFGNSSVSFDVDTSCASYIDAVDAALAEAMDLWNHVPSSALNVSIGGSVTLPSPITTYVGASASSYAPVGNPIVYCDTSFQSDSGLSADAIPGYAAAQNFVTGSGQLQGGLLVLNLQSGGKANIQTLGADLSAIVLAHEIGHVLGLGHSSNPDALMYYATSSSRKLILAQDDVDGISFLYPRQEPRQGGLMGCATIARVGGGTAASAAWRAKDRDGKGDGGGPSAGALELSALLAFCAAAWRAIRRIPVRATA